MVTISVHHPDIEKFAKMKADKTAVTKANVSIRITDEFMRAVESDSDYEQRRCHRNGELLRLSARRVLAVCSLAVPPVIISEWFYFVPLRQAISEGFAIRQRDTKRLCVGLPDSALAVTGLAMETTDL